MPPHCRIQLLCAAPFSAACREPPPSLGCTERTCQHHWVLFCSWRKQRKKGVTMLHWGCRGQEIPTAVNACQSTEQRRVQQCWKKNEKSIRCCPIPASSVLCPASTSCWDVPCLTCMKDVPFKPIQELLLSCTQASNTWGRSGGQQNTPVVWQGQEEVMVRHHPDVQGSNEPDVCSSLGYPQSLMVCTTLDSLCYLSRSLL